MLNKKLRWLYHSQNLDNEVMQCTSEGKDISLFLREIEQIKNMPEGQEKEEAACTIMKKLEELPVAKSYPYLEPDKYEEIIGILDEDCTQTYSYDIRGYRDRLYGAWTGRAVGCLLGIPVETWERGKIESFLKDTSNYPLACYMSSQLDEKIKEKYNINDLDEMTPYDRQMVCWINNVKEFPVDDDTNYSVASLRLVERYGAGFTAENVAESWLSGFPVLHACTAERIAYKNLVNCIPPPFSAKYLNPYREWVGAQIRSDFYGYISPGNPNHAASMAFRDASVSHVKNGIYGSMYTAALISLASCGKEPLWMVKTALKQIPPSSRLYENINKICEMFSAGKKLNEIIDFTHGKFDEKNWFNWCHTIPNAMIVTVNLLFFGGDFDAAITNTVMSGFDTDCNGATVGSIVGMILGKKGIDCKWLKPVEPKIATSVHGYHSLTLEELVERTYKLVLPMGSRKGEFI